MSEIRTKAVVHLDRLKNNIELVLKKLPSTCNLIAVVKGDAYGHGIAGVYPLMKELGIKHYAVSVWEEGKLLRECGADSEDILILGDTVDDQQDKLIQYRLAPTIFDVEAAGLLNEKARAAGIIQPIHIKIDTGMSRIGFPPGKTALESVKRIASMSNLKISGAFTHFACADELDNPKTDEQLKVFSDTVKLLRENGIDIPVIHTANSPSTLLRPNTYLDAVRTGDALFGLCPIDEDLWLKSGFKEVLSWETYVAMVKTVPAGTEVGYGATFKTEKETVIATVPVGFADGYNRKLSNKGVVVINGCKAPIIGRVCMDQFMVDATEVEGIKRGDKVELLGVNFGILDMARLLDVNVDEIVCNISKRVPRIYK